MNRHLESISKILGGLILLLVLYRGPTPVSNPTNFIQIMFGRYSTPEGTFVILLIIGVLFIIGMTLIIEGINKALETYPNKS